MTTSTGACSVYGQVAPGFEAVRDELARIAADESGFSAQFGAYAGGRLVVDLWCGPDIGPDSIQGVFSATKGAAGICTALLVERGALDLDAPVSRYWPEFAQGGKQAVTVRTALSHQAGLAGVEPQLTLDQLIDHDYLAGRLAAQIPHWHPGSAHGYHAVTIGTIVDELVRRIDGRTIARFFHEDIAEPRGIDFFIATPDAEEHRVRDVLPARPAAPSPGAEPMVNPVDSLAGMAFNAAAQDPFDPLPANVHAVRAAGMASIGGTGSARGLARLYASCIDELDGRARLLGEQTVASVSQLQTAGPDLVLGIPTRFAVVFQKPDDRLRYGSHQAFGHDGAGGVIGAADPWHGLAYGYVPRRMVAPAGADPRGMRLAGTLRRCLAASPA